VGDDILRFLAYTLYTIGILLLIVLNVKGFPGFPTGEKPDWKRMEMEMKAREIENKLRIEPENVDLLFELAKIYDELGYEEKMVMTLKRIEESISKKAEKLMLSKKIERTDLPVIKCILNDSKSRR